MSPWHGPAACSGQGQLQEGQRGLKAALVPPAREALPPRDSRDSGVQCETGAPWRGSTLEGAVLGSLCREGEGKTGQDFCAAAEWVRPEPSARPLIQRGQVSWVVARESKLPNFPPVALHTWLIPLLKGCPTPSWCFGKHFSFNTSSTGELSDLSAQMQKAGMHTTGQGRPLWCETGPCHLFRF